MVVRTNKIDGTPIKHESYPQTARIIQWLGGERAGIHFFFHSSSQSTTDLLLVDVPAEFDVTSSLKEDFVDHQIIASKVECIELLRLKPIVSSSP